MSDKRHDKPKEQWTKIDWDAEYQHRTMMFLLYEAILREQGRAPSTNGDFLFESVAPGDFLFESVDQKESYQDIKNSYENFLIVHRDAVREILGKPPGDTPHPDAI